MPGTQKAIGGFLPLRLGSSSASGRSYWDLMTAGVEAGWYFHNARSALATLLAQQRPSRVWLPAFVCVEVAATVPPGTATMYYTLDDDLYPRVDLLARSLQEGDCVVGVEYFGRPLPSEFRELVAHRRDVGWIEDRAHALAPAKLGWGDWLLYSPRKVTGVPDGGVLVARSKTLPPSSTVPLVDMSFVAPALARFEDFDECHNERWYAAYRDIESRMAVGNLQMSRLTSQLLRQSNADADGALRRRNFAILAERLERHAFIRDHTPEFAPLGFPIHTNDAQNVSESLARQRIFAARHWKELPSDAAVFRAEHNLAATLLTLPCDYRYDTSDMYRVADAVLRLLT